jgi:hypothetical protein
MKWKQIGSEQKPAHPKKTTTTTIMSKTNFKETNCNQDGEAGKKKN